ncbi:MAG: hypothetical protein ACK51K_15665 [Gammaproteobacteria bacterium]|jgi:hypothetical protein
MRTTVRIIVCSAVALMPAAPAMAGAIQLYGGLWQIERWREEPGGSEPRDRYVTKECVPQAADLVTGLLGLTSASSGSTLIRVTVDGGRTVIDKLAQQDTYVTMQSPWMLRSITFSDLTLRSSVVRKVDGLGVRFGYRSQTWALESGIPTATTPASFVFGAEGRRMGDCPSEFRFMTLRELWRSIFQWGF